MEEGEMADAGRLPKMGGGPPRQQQPPQQQQPLEAAAAAPVAVAVAVVEGRSEEGGGGQSPPARIDSSSSGSGVCGSVSKPPPDNNGGGGDATSTVAGAAGSGALDGKGTVVDAAAASTVAGAGAGDGGGLLYSEGDKAGRIALCACGDVHTQAFHLAWSSFFVAFFSWFAVPPLLPTIRESLGLTSRQVHWSHLAAIGSSFVARIAIGPLIDGYGPKRSVVCILLLGACTFFFAPLVTGWRGLIALRACTGILGATFVCGQAWTALMFQRSIVGRANALVAGWGNIGGGVSQFAMVEFHERLLHSPSNTKDPKNTWRLALLLPSGMLILAALVVWALGTDTPRGDIAALKKRGQTPPSPKASLRAAARDWRTWVLALQYAVSFGVELVALNTAASYFHERLAIPALTAGRLATYAGASNVLARPLGGWASDKANARFGAKGRLWVQFLLVVLDGVFLLRFARARSKGAAAGYLLVFSVFVQAASGSCFALVPYLSRQSGGAVAGIVSSGGNMGCILFTLMFAQADAILKEPSRGFAVMGWVVLACAPTVWLIRPGALEGGTEGSKGEGGGGVELVGVVVGGGGVVGE